MWIIQWYTLANFKVFKTSHFPEKFLLSPHIMLHFHLAITLPILIANCFWQLGSQPIFATLFIVYCEHEHMNTNYEPDLATWANYKLIFINIVCCSQQGHYVIFYCHRIKKLWSQIKPVCSSCGLNTIESFWNSSWAGKFGKFA